MPNAQLPLSFLALLSFSTLIYWYYLGSESGARQEQPITGGTTVLRPIEVSHGGVDYVYWHLIRRAYMYFAQTIRLWLPIR